MKISALIELLTDIKEAEGDLNVTAGSRDENERDVTGVWILQGEGCYPILKLAVPFSGSANGY